ncbi:MAG: 2-oxoglutarate dehydrogenase E1 component [Ghiorsea sp.]|nr:2-oxoglutarate dehydrogenase E1 component [Ghiorsea sp.]
MRITTTNHVVKKQEMPATKPQKPTVKKADVSTDLYDIEYPSRALYLINAWRMHGHLRADLDPLKLNPPHIAPDMELAYYGLSEADLDTPFPTGDLVAPAQLPLREILSLLKQTYSGHIAPELMHISDTARRNWLQHKLEGARSTPQFNAEQRKHIFSMVMKAEEFERFLHTRYTGQKRFSLEGGESLIPMLDNLIQRAGGKGVKEIILGMAHRGRLNVLANILGKSLSDIFAEFEGNKFADAESGAGDVKYHMGFSSDISTEKGTVHLSLGFNPSHLEIISPVVLGSVRARQCRRKDNARRQVMGVLIHGDAAFAGQGVVAESLNLGDLSGYRTGGTIHIVVNNQIGFTTNPFDARSTFYCTDVAKLVQAPILHVNGDDPEACCMAMELAMDYRHKFRSDVVIDLICYRKLGHNEADAPEVTQPKMYQRIQEHPSVQSIYREQLAKDGVQSEDESLQTAKFFRECLDSVRKNNIAAPQQAPKHENSLHGRWEGFVRHTDEEPDTTVDETNLKRLVSSATTVPEGFKLHPKVQKIYANRVAMIHDDMPIDWGCAEMMAYASLVDEGGWVRLTGQDSGRGTFFHRHAIVYDQNTGKGFTPLRQLRQGELSRFLVVDSMLSEMAVMAYEYGYSVAEPRALVIWEAQYGDFANMAQVVIDQFVAAGESKWNRMSGLTLWLPHGYEGQGAEHSSARLERFLQLCSNDNMQVACPTTPAQIFHLLRRQHQHQARKPLIIMAPKSMLRNKASTSTVSDLVTGAFQPILDNTCAGHARRVILCSGKVYYDLLEARNKHETNDTHIIRIERLYPFPAAELTAIMKTYTDCKEVVWLQEEPINQGAWRQIKHVIQDALLSEQTLYVLARDALAAPAVGSIKRHNEEKEYLMTAALGTDTSQLLEYKMGWHHV